MLRIYSTVGDLRFVGREFEVWGYFNRFSFCVLRGECVGWNEEKRIPYVCSPSDRLIYSTEVLDLKSTEEESAFSL